MASRTPEFRETVLRLDNYHCQICGFDGRDENRRGFLEADHVIPRAGKASMDRPENGMTLCSLCHKKKTNKEINILHWDRDDKESGLMAVDENGADLNRVWFYSEKDRVLLERGLEALRIMASSEAQKARILAHVWNNSYLTDASPAQLVSQVGLDPNDSALLAETFMELEKIGLEWPSGMNLAKARLALVAAQRLVSCNPDDREGRVEELQETISYAAVFSYTDFERELIDKGFLDSTSSPSASEKKNLFLYVPREVVDGGITLFNGTDEQMARRCHEDGGVAVRVGKVIHPLRKHGGKVSVKDGLIERDIDIIDLID